MKKIVILAILAFGIITIGCEKNSDEYYIKYAAGAQTAYASMDIDITYENEENEIETVYTTIPSWNMIIGPVEEGFNAALSIATRREINNTTLVANIQVSKNDGPFVIKASGANDTSEPLEIEYSIDF
jgi:hypothetical protein